MVYWVYDNENIISTLDLNSRDKLKKGKIYKCINPNCTSELYFTNGYSKKNNSQVSSHFKHKNLNTSCQVKKIFDKNIENYSSKFFKKWIHIAQNNNLNRCNVYENNIMIDIINYNSSKYLINNNLMSERSVDSIYKNKINNLLLSGYNRQCNIYEIDNEFYIDFLCKNDIPNFDDMNTNIYIDYDKNKIVKLLRNNDFKFDDKIKNIILYIKNNSLLNMPNLVNSRLLKIDLIDIYDFVKQNFDVDYGHSHNIENIKINTDINDLINAITNTINAKNNVNYSKKEIYDYIEKEIYDSCVDLKNNNIMDNTLFRDENLIEGMKIYFEFYKISTENITHLVDSINKKQIATKDNYIIHSQIKGLLRLDINKINNDSIKLLFDNNALLSFNKDKGYIDIIKGWYIISYLKKIGLDKKLILQNLHKYPLLKKKIDKHGYNIDDNIYILCTMFDFQDIDKIFLKNNNIYDKRRIDTAIKFFLKEKIYYVDDSEIKNVLCKKLDIDFNKLNHIFQTYTVRANNAGDKFLMNICVDNKYCNYENIIKKFLNKLLTKSSNLFTTINTINHFNQDLYDSQQDSMLYAINEPISIITGGPGTGKSHVISRIYNYYLKINRHINVLAFTGTAVKVIKDKIKNNLENKNAKEDHLDNICTIDSFIIKNNKKNKKNKNNNIEIIIIDEFSMVSLKLFYKLVNVLANCNKLSKLIIVGDPNQLPSIDVGNILFDFLNYGKNILTDNFLENEYYFLDQYSSGCIKSTNLIENKRSNNLKIPKSSDYILNNNFEQLKEYLLLHDLWKKSKTFFDEKINTIIHEINQTMILCNNKKKEYGSNDINKKIKKILNKTDQKFCPNDRIMCIKNMDIDDYKFYNGDLFHIKDIDANNILIIDGSNTEYKISQCEMINFKLCWAMTIHKSQGKEWNNVYIFLNDSSKSILNKNILYTAITRAKKNFTLICDEYTLKKCINNNINMAITLLPFKNRFHNNLVVNKDTGEKNDGSNKINLINNTELKTTDAEDKCRDTNMINLTNNVKLKIEENNDKLKMVNRINTAEPNITNIEEKIYNFDMANRINNMEPSVANNVIIDHPKLTKTKTVSISDWIK